MSAPTASFTDDALEASLHTIQGLLTHDYGLSHRAIGQLLLQGDEEITARVKAREAAFPSIAAAVDAAKTRYPQPLPYVIALRRQREASRIVGCVVEHEAVGSLPFAAKLSRWMIQPLTGFPILLLVLYFGIYEFVGKFGAGVMVDFIENGIFERYVNPHVTRFVTGLIPWPTWSDLLVGEYGMITLGFRYAVALILPIVTTFFIAFAVIEDTGYLPRLSLLIDRLFKKFGLTGRAVIPMVLGLGCDTMATMVTRTLPTVRERIIATILLAVAVPCSAQLGVILSLLEGNPIALWVWLGVLCLVFLFIGYLSSKI